MNWSSYEYNRDVRTPMSIDTYASMAYELLVITYLIARGVEFFVEKGHLSPTQSWRDCWLSPCKVVTVAMLASPRPMSIAAQIYCQILLLSMYEKPHKSYYFEFGGDHGFNECFSLFSFWILFESSRNYCNFGWLCFLILPAPQIFILYVRIQLR